jgi:hypothetical protein
MWLESVIGLYLGCEAYAVLTRRAWRGVDPDVEICHDGACATTQLAG